MKDTTQKPEYNGLQLINREVIISYLKQLLQIDSRLGEFKILGLEEKAYDNISIIKFPCDLPNQTPQASSLKIGGIIDRFDMVKDEEGMVRIRVVDYKTGHKPTQQVNSVEEIFSGEKIREKHTDYFLQAFLYSIIIRHSKKFNEKSIPVSPALLFIQHAGADDYTPILSIEQEEIKDVEVYGKEFKERLTSIVNEIFDPKVPFSPTEDSSRCTYCPYYRLCNM
jgi:CRISPR/Cas system-associated exonuclease Cas4 (RecB family)